MYIQLVGGNFINKGDELMLRALVDMLSVASHNVKLVATNLLAPYHDRAQLGLYQRLWTPKLSRLSGTLGYLILKRYRASFGIVLEQEIDAVIDFSGFAYGDQWGPGTTTWTASQAPRWRKQGKRLVFMPQAFGPFSTKKMRSGMRVILENADILFARDRQSFAYLNDIYPDAPNIEMAPDFTNLVRGIPPTDVAIASRTACVVPNYRMIDKTDDHERERYVPFLAMCIRELRNWDLEPVLLLHEARSDEELLGPIKDAAGGSLRIIRHADPVAIKGIIGKSFLLIGSRFHSLVSALSQAVPCLGTGWSHKYAMLFEDYGCERHLVSPTIDRQELRALIAPMVEESSRADLIRRLQEAACEQQQRSRAMWKKVGHVLGLDLSELLARTWVANGIRA